MKRLCYLAAALLAVSFASQAVAQNLLVNEGFELPTLLNANGVGNWSRFEGGGFSSDSTVDPHSGQSHLALETSGLNGFAGAFQRLSVPVTPGQIVTFTGWHKSVGPAPYDAVSEIKLEWQGPGAPAPNPQQLLTTDISPTADYTKFTITAPAPAGTAGLVATYAIASFAPGLSTGVAEVYIDDFSVTVVPEPATAGMLGLGLLGLARIRRRK